MDESKCVQAIPRGTLLEQIMNSSLAKSDREWAAAEEIEALRQRVQELEEQRDSFYMDYRIKCDEETKRLEAELAALKQAQGEPVAWKLDCGINPVYTDKRPDNDLWQPLYTSPPTVAAMRKGEAE